MPQDQPGPGPSSSGSKPYLLVGGQGTRLRPLTIGVPKPLLPTAGVPFLAHQLSRVAEAGVSRVVLATAYRAQMFADSLGDGSAFGLEICYVQEDTPLGTGGAIRNAAAGLRGGPGDAVIVLNGDILSGHDLTAQVKAHHEARAAVTLHLVEVDGPVPVRLRAHRCRGAGHRLPGEDPGPGHQPDQRGLLRVPARGHRRDTARGGQLGGAQDLPGADQPRAKSSSVMWTPPTGWMSGLPRRSSRGRVTLSSAG